MQTWEFHCHKKVILKWLKLSKKVIVPLYENFSYYILEAFLQQIS